MIVKYHREISPRRIDLKAEAHKFLRLKNIERATSEPIGN